MQTTTRPRPLFLLRRAITNIVAQPHPRHLHFRSLRPSHAAHTTRTPLRSGLLSPPYRNSFLTASLRASSSASGSSSSTSRQPPILGAEAQSQSQDFQQPSPRSIPLSSPPPQPSPHTATTESPPDDDIPTNVPSYLLTFTCKPCGFRSSHRVTKQGYHHGTVLIQCPSCKNRHVISDHLRIFLDREDGGTLDEILRRKHAGPNGEVELRHLVKRGRITLTKDQGQGAGMAGTPSEGAGADAAGDFEFWDDGAEGDRRGQ